MFVFPNRLCELHVSSMLPGMEPVLPTAVSLLPSTAKSSRAFQRGISKTEFETGNWLHRKCTEMGSWMLLPWGLEGHRRGMVSPESEAEAVPWLGLARTLEGRAGWWGTGTIMGKWCSKQSEMVNRKNLASPYFSISSLLLVPPILTGR